MKTHLIPLTFIILVFTSCGDSKRADQQAPETPKALEDKNSSLEIISKRGSTDLVESLYKELSDRTPELKELENRIDDLSGSEHDSTRSFQDYNGKNQSYYSSAGNHMEQIKDSVLKEKMKVLISTSLANYNSSISRHNGLLTSIEAQNLTLGDLHTILKITRTLPMIEKYQKDNLPGTKPLEGFSRELEKTIKYADTLVKK